MLSEGTKNLIKKYGIENLQQCIASASEQRKFDQQYLLDFVISNNELIAETRVKTSQYKEQLRIQQQLLGQLQDRIIEVQRNLEKSSNQANNDNIDELFEQINSILQNMSSTVMKFFLRHNCRAFASYVIKNNAFDEYIHNPELYKIYIKDINAIINMFEATDDVKTKNALLVKIITNMNQESQNIEESQAEQDSSEQHNYLVSKKSQIQPFMLETLITVLSNYEESGMNVFSNELFENYTQQLIYLYSDSYIDKAQSLQPVALKIDQEVILEMLYQLEDYQIAQIKQQIITDQNQAVNFIKLAGHDVKAYKQIFESRPVLFIEGIISPSDITKDAVMKHLQGMDGNFLSNKTVYEVILELESQIQDKNILNMLIDKFVAKPALQFQAKECLRDKEGVVASVLQLP